MNQNINEATDLLLNLDLAQIARAKLVLESGDYVGTLIRGSR